MEHTVKQRLIGAIVLVAIAVIFLPGILGQKPQREVFVSEFEQSPKQVVEQTIDALTDKPPANNTESKVDSTKTSDRLLNSDKTESLGAN
ncbi:MAG: hypothetical protein V2I33_13215, partial [Kangiellaceae bacterium]|nr:hypothetical protein [Kangiellaceae bacterium]